MDALMLTSCRSSIVALLLVLLEVSGSQGQNEKPATPSAAAIQFFESKIRPVLADNCYKCHGDEKPKGGLRLSSRAAMLEGGDQGPALVPGDPAKSLLIKAVNQTDEHLKMPPKKKLSPQQIADLTQWVKIGAPWPGGDTKTAAPPRKGELQVTDKDRAHWAFQRVKRPAVPAVQNSGTVANPIDAFILAKLEAKGLRANPPAEKRELIRRLYYDLLGLPPTPEEVEAWLNDKSPNAYERLVDRLLDSPHYGEKWGRHWLDLVRYAETNSYERDNPKPNAWRYRDYVIRSFNNDKPYDQFIREQLAGDELPYGEPGASAPGASDDDAFIATGYYRLGIWDDEPTDREQARYDGLDDIVTTTGQVFLGLTLDCARCHDHKIDPVPQKDYYRFLAFFQNINHYRNGGPTDEVVLGDQAGRASYEQQVKALEKQRQELQTALTAFEEEFRKLYEQVNGSSVPKEEVPRLIRMEGAKLLGQDRFARYQEQRREFDNLKKQTVPGEKALCVSEAGNRAPETFVMIRGNPHVKGDKVEPAFPLVLTGASPLIPTTLPNAKTTGRRLALANWLASPDNALTARVMVNRIWQHHFGRGIVRSPNNFGTQGDRPTHPELLDWLASEFVRQGWRLKPLHRLIVTSNAYRMSSRGNAAAQAADQINDLFWRFDMRRLSGEEIRDSILAVTGSLNPKMYGRSVYVDIPKEVLAGQSAPGYGWGKSPPDEQNRRSIYIHVKRSLLTPILESFDLAETDRTTPVRFTTTQPTQALGMLNGDFLNQQAALLARRLKAEAGDDVTKQVRLALRLVTQRQPSDSEIQRGVGLMETLQRRDKASPELALKYFCLMALSLNEFVYLD
jgi:hypothetical protein